MSDLISFVLSVKEQWRKILTGSLVLALIWLVQGARGFRFLGFVYWLIICATLFWAFFGAWRQEHRARQKAEAGLLSKDEKRLLRKIRKLFADFIELMRCYPDSECVLSPFSITWRPVVGTTDVGIDKQRTIAWHKECLSFIDELADVFGHDQAVTLGLPKILARQPFPQFPPTSVECLFYLNDIEGFLLKKALQKEEEQAQDATR